MKANTRELTDSALRDEIELIAELVIAASGCHGRMSDTQIDEALGLSPRRLMSA